mmetsp:Transcript_132981/g.315152  ORF Transcript_132981/g.315152 Transcript_132981/m.315152 type:complete len:201 (+) Transcript_132981:174-776(+)
MDDAAQREENCQNEDREGVNIAGQQDAKHNTYGVLGEVSHRAIGSVVLSEGPLVLHDHVLLRLDVLVDEHVSAKVACVLLHHLRLVVHRRHIDEAHHSIEDHGRKVEVAQLVLSEHLNLRVVQRLVAPRVDGVGDAETDETRNNEDGSDEAGCRTGFEVFVRRTSRHIKQRSCLGTGHGFAEQWTCEGRGVSCLFSASAA